MIALDSLAFCSERPFRRIDASLRLWHRLCEISLCSCCPFLQRLLPASPPQACSLLTRTFRPTRCIFLACNFSAGLLYLRSDLRPTLTEILARPYGPLTGAGLQSPRLHLRRRLRFHSHLCILDLFAQIPIKEQKEGLHLLLKSILVTLIPLRNSLYELVEFCSHGFCSHSRCSGFEVHRRVSSSPPSCSSGILALERLPVCVVWTQACHG